MNGGQEEINLFFKHLAECNSLQPAIDTAFAEGFKEGKRNGVMKEMVKRMQAANFDVEMIEKLTGLTTQEVEALKGQ